MKNANLVSLGGVWLLALGSLIGLAGCAEEAPVVAARKTVADHFPIAVGSQVVRMQVAVTLPEMQRGLMERRDLGADEGMLFVYERPQQLSFWMRNTPTPLDIGFFTPTGELREIYPLHPFDEQAVTSRSDRLQFALEVNQGWFRERGVKPGDQLDLAGLARALTARGFSPQTYGLE